MARKFTKLFALLLLVTLSVTPLAAASKGKSIAADHKELVYTGRIDFSDKKAPKLSWPGSMVRATFTGSSIQVVLNCSTGKNYFDVYIDEKYDSPTKIDCEKGSKTYSVATNLKGKSHTVTLYKRTEGEEGSAQFQGFVLSEKGELLDAPARPEKRIEFFGDSITSGYGCERGPRARDGQVVDKNSFKSYAGVAAKELNAECHFTSCSGIGVVGGWTPFTMPQLYERLSANEINGTKWDFKKWVPHVVVVNLFENDRSRARASDEQILEGYVKFVNSLRTAYPEAHVVCALGSMSAARKGSKWIGFVEKAVAQIREQDKTAKIDSVIFLNNGQGSHPRADRHKEMAKKLTDLINAKVTWRTKSPDSR